MKPTLVYLFLCLAALLSACGVKARALPTPTRTPAPGAAVIQAGIFTISGGEEDRQAVEDVARALQDHLGEVGRELDFDMQAPVIVELFANQESLDREGMNPEMQGYYAYSGDRRIQIVSPRNALPGMDTPYDQRVLIAVHELAHLILNEINPDIPLWLNEGAAVYAAPHEVYTYVCEHRFPFDKIPKLAQLEEDYDSVPAADLFAYALVDTITSTYGREARNRLLRDPAQMESILGMSRAEIESGWREFMASHYKSD